MGSSGVSRVCLSVGCKLGAFVILLIGSSVGQGQGASVGLLVGSVVEEDWSHLWCICRLMHSYIVLLTHTGEEGWVLSDYPPLLFSPQGSFIAIPSQCSSGSYVHYSTPLLLTLSTCAQLPSPASHAHRLILSAWTVMRLCMLVTINANPHFYCTATHTALLPDSFPPQLFIYLFNLSCSMLNAQCSMHSAYLVMCSCMFA